MPLRDKFALAALLAWSLNTFAGFTEVKPFEGKVVSFDETRVKVEREGKAQWIEKSKITFSGRFTVGQTVRWMPEILEKKK